MSEQVRNEAGNEGGSVTGVLPKVRADLRALRKKHGADSAIGHRASNVLEQLENFAKSDNAEQRRHLDAAIMRQMAELSALRRGQCQ